MSSLDSVKKYVLSAYDYVSQNVIAWVDHIQTSQEVSSTQMIPVLGLGVKYVQNKTFYNNFATLSDDALLDLLKTRDYKKEYHYSLLRTVITLAIGVIFSSPWLFALSSFEAYNVFQDYTQMQAFTNREQHLRAETLSADRPLYTAEPSAETPPSTGSAVMVEG